jgi:hypothetical protein
MSDQKHFLQDFTPVTAGTWFISRIGDTQLEVMGRGNIRATVEVLGKTYSRIINDVLYVPGLGINLFSIAAAT